MRERERERGARRRRVKLFTGQRLSFYIYTQIGLVFGRPRSRDCVSTTAVLLIAVVRRVK